MEGELQMTTELAEKAEVQIQMIDMTDKAQELEITSQETFGIAGEYLSNLTAMKKKIVAYHKEAKESTRNAKDIAYQKEKDDLKPIAVADTYIRGIRQTYQAEQDRIHRKEQERLETEAKKKADAERERLLEEATNAKPEKQEEILKKAEEIVEEPVFAPKAVEKTTKMAGGATSTWINDIEATVTDPLLLCLAIAQGKVPVTIVEFKNLKQWVKTNAIKQGQIPGLNIREFKREAIRA